MLKVILAILLLAVIALCSALIVLSAFILDETLSIPVTFWDIAGDDIKYDSGDFLLIGWLMILATIGIIWSLRVLRKEMSKPDLGNCGGCGKPLAEHDLDTTEK